MNEPKSLDEAKEIIRKQRARIADLEARVDALSQKGTYYASLLNKVVDIAEATQMADSDKIQGILSVLKT